MPCPRDSVGGGVVAEFFRDLKNPMRFSGGGGGGGVGAHIFRKFLFSVTSKRNFQLMGPGPPPESATAVFRQPTPAAERVATAQEFFRV